MAWKRNYDGGPVDDAWRRSLPPCPKCEAVKGDACRMPSNRTTWPHKERPNAVHTKDPQ